MSGNKVLKCGCTLCPHHARAKTERAKVSGLDRFVWKRDKGECQHCGKDLRKVRRPQLDHIVPISKGGLSTMENLQFLCPDCHSEKTTKDRAS